MLAIARHRGPATTCRSPVPTWTSTPWLYKGSRWPLRTLPSGGIVVAWDLWPCHCSCAFSPIGSIAAVGCQMPEQREDCGRPVMQPPPPPQRQRRPYAPMRHVQAMPAISTSPSQSLAGQGWLCQLCGANGAGAAQQLGDRAWPRLVLALLQAAAKQVIFCLPHASRVPDAAPAQPQQSGQP